MQQVFSKQNPKDRLVLAVSGGSDSMAMLLLAQSALPVGQIVVLTVDHGLRSESRAEAEDVARACAAFAIEHHVLSWEGAKPSTGIQAKARSMRYDLMARWCSDHNIKTLLTAHTMEDQAETVAMRLARTQSPKSIAAIWPETFWNGIRIVRPLLGHRRDALREYLRARNQTWIEDPSNDNPIYERVRIRKAMPSENITQLVRQAESARAHVLALQAEAKVQARSLANISPLGHVTLHREGLRELRPDVLAELLSWAIMLAGSGQDVEPASVLRVAEKVLASKPFRSTLGGAVIAGRSKDILVGREYGRIPSTSTLIESERAILWDGRFYVDAPKGSEIRAAGPEHPRVDKSIPAFVTAALPLATLPRGEVILPHFQAHNAVSVSLGERFQR